MVPTAFYLVTNTRSSFLWSWFQSLWLFCKWTLIRLKVSHFHKTSRNRTICQCLQKAFADVSVNFDNNFFRLYEFSSVVINQQELSKKKCKKPFPYVLKHKEISLKKLKQLNYLFLADKGKKSQNKNISHFHFCFRPTENQSRKLCNNLF